MSVPLLLIQSTHAGAGRATRLLTGCPIQVFLCEFGASGAIAAFLRMRAEGREPRIVITGLSLAEEHPEGGLNFIREIRRIAPTCIIVVWTKHSEHYRRLALEAGANAAYAKYVADDHMADDIVKMLGASAACRP